MTVTRSGASLLFSHGSLAHGSRAQAAKAGTGPGFLGYVNTMQFFHGQVYLGGLQQLYRYDDGAWNLVQPQPPLGQFESPVILSGTEIRPTLVTNERVQTRSEGKWKTVWSRSGLVGAVSADSERPAIIVGRDGVTATLTASGCVKSQVLSDEWDWADLKSVARVGTEVFVSDGNEVYLKEGRNLRPCGIKLPPGEYGALFECPNGAFFAGARNRLWRYSSNQWHELPLPLISSLRSHPWA